MLYRGEIIRKLGEEEQRWLARCQVIAALFFIAIFAALLWSAFATDRRSIGESSAPVTASDLPVKSLVSRDPVGPDAEHQALPVAP